MSVFEHGFYLFLWLVLHLVLVLIRFHRMCAGYSPSAREIYPAHFCSLLCVLEGGWPLNCTTHSGSLVMWLLGGSVQRRPCCIRFHKTPLPHSHWPIVSTEAVHFFLQPQLLLGGFCPMAKALTGLWQPHSSLLPLLTEGWKCQPLISFPHLDFSSINSPFDKTSFINSLSVPSVSCRTTD